MISQNRKPKKPTANDVAIAAGVSKWTVIRAFKKDSVIAEDTRERVLEVANTLNYQPNLLAKSLATKRSNQIAILVDEFDNPYMLPILAKLTMELQRNDLVGIFLNINEGFDLQKAVISSAQRQFDAIVMVACSDESLRIANLFDKVNIPSFVLARESLIDNIPSISINVEPAITTICDHLVERGYRKPGFMFGPRKETTALGRRKFFRAYWEDHIGKRPIEIAAKSYSWAASKDSMRGYLGGVSVDDRCDVLMCENDILAIGALETARSEFNLSIPEDMAIVGFDDIEIASYPSIGLTTYRQPFDKMVMELVEMIAGRALTRSLFLEGELVTRTST